MFYKPPPTNLQNARRGLGAKQYPQPEQDSREILLMCELVALRRDKDSYWFLSLFACVFLPETNKFSSCLSAWPP